MFDIVKFPPDSDDDEAVETVEIVPNSWITNENGNTCTYWPNTKDVTRHVIAMKPPHENWAKLPVTILNKKPYGDYKQAVAKRNTALDNSDLSGIENTPTTSRKRNTRRPDYLHDEEYELPPENTKKLRLALQVPKLRLVIPDPEPNYQTNTAESTDSSNEGHVTFPETQDQDFQEVFTLDTHNNGYEDLLSGLGELNQKVSEIRQEQIFLKMTLSNIDSKINLIASNISLQQAPVVLENVLKNPFQDIFDFLQFEGEIKNSKETYDALKAQFAFIGGTGVSDCVNRIMKKVMTPELANEYSQYGFGKGNRNFSITTTYKVILDSLRSSKQIQESEISKALVEWFRRTGERLKAMNAKRMCNNRDRT